MSFLSGLLGLDAGKATRKAAKENIKSFENYRDIGNTIINDGQNESRAALDQAIAAYSPYAQSGQAANTMYSNALGLNGADGNTAATSAFQAGPGYQFALDQGTQAALRGASAGGMLNSGNTLTALAGFGQGLANQEYGGWLDRLAGQSAQGLQAASGQAQGYGNMSNIFQNSIDRRLGLEGAYTQGITGQNNQIAQGHEASRAAFAGLGSNIIGGATKLISGGLF
jgi:hypothetical protein